MADRWFFSVWNGEKRTLSLLRYIQLLPFRPIREIRKAYWGAVYVKTESLWCSILLHFILDLCALPYAFSACFFSWYEQIIRWYRWWSLSLSLCWWDATVCWFWEKIRNPNHKTARYSAAEQGLCWSHPKTKPYGGSSFTYERFLKCCPSNVC